MQSQAPQYNMSLPEFMRVAWVSEEARKIWEPRIQAISRAWEEIERLAVVHGLRDAALQVIAPEKMIDLSIWASTQGLVALPISMQGVSNGYSAATQPVVAGERFAYRVVIANPDTARAFMDAWKSGDDGRIGFYLGYPDCCRSFFQKYWKEGWKDTTYPMVNCDGHLLRVAGPTECNILLRWLGLRFVSHLPCSFDCERTTSIGIKLANLGRNVGFVDEIEWLHTILEWPVRWDSTHGVAIITTPCFKIVTYSTPLKERVIVDREGSIYPLEGASGIEFPFQNQMPLRLVRKEIDPKVYETNGFRSFDGMQRAHSLLLSIIPVIEGGVLDLGCGNGVLLTKIKAQNSGVTGIYGVDQKDHHRINPDIIFKHGNIVEQVWDEKFDLVLLAEQRLLELTAPQVTNFLSWLRQATRWVILYNYDAWDGSVDKLISDDFTWTDGKNEGRMQAHLLRSKNEN